MTAVTLAPEHRDLLDLEIEYTRKGDATGLYLVRRVNELEELIAWDEDIAAEQIDTLQTALDRAVGQIEDMHTFLLDGDHEIDDETLKKLTKYCEDATRAEDYARKGR